jgi:hypothetical protein
MPALASLTSKSFRLNTEARRETQGAVALLKRRRQTVTDLGLLFGVVSIVAFGTDSVAWSAVLCLTSLACVYAGECVFVGDPKTRGLVEATKVLNRRRMR